MEDTAMLNEDQGTISLQEYISQYSGYQKIIRLQSVINEGHSLNDSTVLEAIQMGYKIAASSNNLGMYLRI